MLRIEKVSKIFNEHSNFQRLALTDITLSINPEDVITIIGSNGAGKSTLFAIISGALKPSTGVVYFGEEDITAKEEYQRAGFIGKMFQNPLHGTAPQLSIIENLTIAINKTSYGLRRAISKQIRAEIQERLSILGMGLEDRLNAKVATLSGGERQALTLLMVILKKPKLLLLDEHTAALDPQYSEKVLQLTQHFISEEKLNALIITHNMNHALSVGNRLYMMHRGRIVRQFAGQEKANLKVPQLVDMFTEIHDGMAHDEILLQ